MSCTQSEHIDFIFDPPDSRNPWDLVPRWPITHGQRIAELKFLATFYNKKGQEQNIQAAINWHSKFPHDELVGYESASFQCGEIIEESKINLQNGPVWYEGPPEDDMMA